MLSKEDLKRKENILDNKNNEHENNMDSFLISLVKNKVENKDFTKATGILELSFSEVAYVNCTFREIDFKYINFSNVIFENCLFELCSFYRCNISYKSIMEIFHGTLQRCNFDLCDLNGIIIKRCKLNVVSFRDVCLSKSNLIKNSFNSVKFIDDCSLIDCIIRDVCCCFNILFVNEKSYTKLSFGSYIGPFNYKDNYYCLKNKSKHHCEKKDLHISNSYMTFGNQYLKNDIHDKYGECFYQSKVAKHRTLKGIKRIVSSASNLVCGYGEKPFRSFGVSLIIIIICAIIYLFTGIKTQSGVINYPKTLMTSGIQVLLQDLLYCIHFSVVTFSTTGYGDLVPYGKLSMLIANVEIITGVIMVAIWTSTLVRKMTR
jgi:hypothetical protein